MIAFNALFNSVEVTIKKNINSVIQLMGRKSRLSNKNETIVEIKVSFF